MLNKGNMIIQKQLYRWDPPAWNEHPFIKQLHVEARNGSWTKLPARLII